MMKWDSTTQKRHFRKMPEVLNKASYEHQVLRSLKYEWTVSPSCSGCIMGRLLRHLSRWLRGAWRLPADDDMRALASLRQEEHLDPAAQGADLPPHWVAVDGMGELQQHHIASTCTQPLV